MIDNYSKGKGFSTLHSDGRHLTPDEVEFGKAVNEYRRRHKRPFPNISELLAILRSLGYRKVPPAQQQETTPCKTQG